MPEAPPVIKATLFAKRVIVYGFVVMSRIFFYQ